MMTAMEGVARVKGRLVRLAREFVCDEDGATAIEYGLIVSLIFLAIVSAVRSYVNSASEMYSDISSAMTN